MTRSIFFALFVVGLMTLISCTSMETRTVILKLEDAVKIKAGISTKTEIQNAFGKPHRVFHLEEHPEKNDDGEVWAYYEGSFTNSSRLSFYFKKGSSVTTSVGWGVRENEPEQNLDTAKKFIAARFSNVNLKEREEGWSNTDSYSDNKYFEDPRLGVAISYRIKRKEVSGISWSEPGLYVEMIEKHRRNLSCLNPDCSDKQNR